MVSMDNQVGFCLNSRRYVDFIMILPKFCPYNYQGNSFCRDEQCEHYEKRTPSRYYLRKMKILTRWHER